MEFFGLLPNFDLVELITWGGIIGVAAIIFAESGLLIGFFLPGDSLLVTAGFLTHQGILDINIAVLAAILFVAAVTGDSVGYAFGHKVGRRLFRKPESLLFKQENIEHAEKFYEKHGSKTIVMARFIPVIRTFAPIVAGIGKMKYRTFLTYNIIGGLLWAVGLSYLGYYAGEWLEQAGIEIDKVLLPIIAVIILISVLPPLIHIFKDAERRKAVIEGTKKQVKAHREMKKTKKEAKRSKN